MTHYVNYFITVMYQEGHGVLAGRMDVGAGLYWIWTIAWGSRALNIFPITVPIQIVSSLIAPEVKIPMAPNHKITLLDYSPNP